MIGSDLYTRRNDNRELLSQKGERDKRDLLAPFRVANLTEFVEAQEAPLAQITEEDWGELVMT